MTEAIEHPGREWWPIDYADEVMPPAFSTPGGWLRPMPLGEGWTIASPYHDDSEEEAERQWPFTALVDGQRVDFMYCDQLEPVTVTVNPDETFETQGLVDPKAAWFWDDDQRGDCPSGDTLEEFAQAYVESEGIKEPKRVRVGCCYWSDKIVFSFTIREGRATLEQAGLA